MQIFKECKRFAKPLGLTTVCVYGGTGVSEQIAELKRGCEIVVCTPGRMIDMLAANNGELSAHAKYYLISWYVVTFLKTDLAGLLLFCGSNSWES